jgi:murein DD-endopeptidase MepM/ murein hydrolase activator NlpD
MTKAGYKEFSFLIFSVYLFLNFTGCASAPVNTITAPTPLPSVPGVYHKVERGQTLWRISKMYDVDLDELIRINRIPDVTNIETGQLLLIPRRQTPLYKDVKEDFIWPVKGRVVASFGQDFKNMLNKGINIQPYGNTDIVASKAGKIVFSADGFYSYGKTLIIDHGDGFSTVYAGLSDVLVKTGDNVSKGSIIANIRQDAKNNYLHFEIRKDHLSKNPYFYLPR